MSRMTSAEAREGDADRWRGEPAFMGGDKVIVDQVWPPKVIDAVEWSDGAPARSDEPGEPSGWLYEVDGDVVSDESLVLWDEDEGSVAA